jgi:hypothetical protein
MGNVLTVPYAQTKNIGYKHMLFSGLSVHLPSLKDYRVMGGEYFGDLKGLILQSPSHMTYLLCGV